MIRHASQVQPSPQTKALYLRGEGQWNGAGPSCTEFRTGSHWPRGFLSYQEKKHKLSFQIETTICRCIALLVYFEKVNLISHLIFKMSYNYFMI